MFATKFVNAVCYDKLLPQLAIIASPATGFPPVVFPVSLHYVHGAPALDTPVRVPVA